MDEGEIFNMYREIPCVARKASWGLKYTQEISDPDFQTGTEETDNRQATTDSRQHATYNRQKTSDSRHQIKR
jgi:hypothetical protein